MTKEVAKIVKSLIGEELFERLEKRFGVEVFEGSNGAVIWVPLNDRSKQQDIVEIETNADGFVHPGQVICYILWAWVAGLNNRSWKESKKRIRKMKF